MMRLVVLMLMLVICFSNQGTAQQTSIAQDSLSRYLQFDESSTFGFLTSYFPPFFIQYEIELKSFIRSKTFLRLRQHYGDTRAIDAIYVKAMEITNDNTAVSLLISAIACFEHRTFHLKVPIFALIFPLTNESEKEFTRRVKNLPAEIYSDTPPSGDRDKMQHFFGSAALSFIFESRQPAERFGDFIEKGEDAFLVDGALDERDMRANRQGQEFGLALLDNIHRVPSEFIKVEIATKHVSRTQGRVDTLKSIGDK
jgi:hypothetical protein